MHGRNATHRKNPRRAVRPAMSLMEMLVLIALFVVITDFALRMIRTFAGDVPRSYRDFQTNVTVQDMLRQLREDVEAGRDIRRMPNDDETASPVLAVTLPDGVVFYEFCPDKVSRGPTVGDPNEIPLHTWPVPQAVFEWQVLARDNQAYALEITTAIERIILARLERKLRNSHVFFVGLANGAEIENASE